MAASLPDLFACLSVERIADFQAEHDAESLGFVTDLSGQPVLRGFFRTLVDHCLELRRILNSGESAERGVFDVLDWFGESENFRHLLAGLNSRLKFRDRIRLCSMLKESAEILRARGLDANAESVESLIRCLSASADVLLLLMSKLLNRVGKRRQYGRKLLRLLPELSSPVSAAAAASSILRLPDDCACDTVLAPIVQKFVDGLRRETGRFDVWSLLPASDIRELRPPPDLLLRLLRASAATSCGCVLASLPHLPTLSRGFLQLALDSTIELANQLRVICLDRLRLRACIGRPCLSLATLDLQRLLLDLPGAVRVLRETCVCLCVSDRRLLRREFATVARLLPAASRHCHGRLSSAYRQLLLLVGPDCHWVARQASAAEQMALLLLRRQPLSRDESLACDLRSAAKRLMLKRMRHLAAELSECCACDWLADLYFSASANRVRGACLRLNGLLAAAECDIECGRVLNCLQLIRRVAA